MESTKSHKTLYDPKTGVKLLTLKEAASYLDYHPFSVYRLVSQGILQPQKFGKKILLFSQEELDRYRVSNEWAARKAAITYDPEAAKEKPSQVMTATITIDAVVPFLEKEETISDFSLDQLPLLKADLDRRYGKKFSGFTLKVTSPDGWKWSITLEPPTLIEKAAQKLRRSI